MIPDNLNSNELKPFCFGEYEVAVDEGPRIRLPRSIKNIFQEHEVNEIWRFADPSGPRMILCPDCSRTVYLRTVSRYFPESLTQDEAFLKYICTGMKAGCALPHQNKISIPSFCHKHLSISPGQRVIMVGTGYWFEVFTSEDWRKLVNT